LLGDRKGIRPVKTSASKPLGMAVNVSVQGTALSTVWVWRVLACPVRTLRMRMTGD